MPREDMTREDLYKKYGVDPAGPQSLYKFLEASDARVERTLTRIDAIEKQLKPLHQAIILNSPNLREELAKRVLKMIGVDGARGVPPTAAQQPMNAYEVTHTPEINKPPRGPANAQPLDASERRVSMGGPENPSVLAFKCRMCINLTDNARRVKVEGHHDIFVCPQCAGKLSDIVSTLLS